MVFKVKINPVNLPVGWTTSTNYTISITEGFVKQIDGNKSPSPVQTLTNAVTTFATIPPSNLYSPVYNSTTRYPIVRINYDRQILFNSTSTTNYYLYQGNTLTQTIASTSTRVSKSTGTVDINLFGLLNTSTTYSLRADKGVFRDMFAFEPNAITDDTKIKFTMSSTYITLAPYTQIETIPVQSAFRGGMSSAIGTNLIAIGSVSSPFIGTVTNVKSNVKIFNTAGNFISQIENPLTHDFKFGVSLAMTDSKLIVGAGSPGGRNDGKIIIYTLSSGTVSTSTTITVPADSSSVYPEAEDNFAGKIAYNGSKFVTLSNNKWYLYSDSGSLIRSHLQSSSSYGNLGESSLVTPSIQPVAINSTLYAYYEIRDVGHTVYIKNIETGSDVYVLNLGMTPTYDGNGRLSIEMDENYIVIGDYISKNCKIYSLSTGDLVYTLTSPDSNSSAFGLYVGITNDYFMVVDPSQSEVASNAQGKIYLFGRSDGQLKKKIDNPFFWDPSYTGSNQALEFGIKSSIKNNLLISSVPAKFYSSDESGTKIGTAFVYNLNS